MATQLDAPAKRCRYDDETGWQQTDGPQPCDDDHHRTTAPSPKLEGMELESFERIALFRIHAW